MMEKFSKLINVKSIVTIMMAIVFCYLAIIKIISAEQFIGIFTVVIAFYFGTQVEKKKEV